MSSQLQRSMVILPSLVTLTATFCGFYSMLVSSQATTSEEFWWAAFLIFLAGVFDGLDGKVARLTHTQTNFGLQLDSLSDAVAFGLAPAWLAYHWGMSSLWPLGLVVAFGFAASCSLRLARYNVMAKDSYDPRYFVGLPSPMGAALMCGLVVTGSAVFGVDSVPEEAQIWVVVYVSFSAALMVSPIRFRGGRGLNKSPRTVGFIVTALSAVVVLSVVYRWEDAVYAATLVYVVVHVFLAVVHLQRRLLGRRTAPTLMESPVGIDDPDDPGEPDDAHEFDESQEPNEPEAADDEGGAYRPGDLPISQDEPDTDEASGVPRSPTSSDD